MTGGGGGAAAMFIRCKALGGLRLTTWELTALGRRREHCAMPRSIARSRYAATLVLLLALAGCTSRVPVPAKADEPPPPYPVQTRERLLRLLDGEWREWGARTLDARSRPTRDSDEGPLAEQHPAAFSKVLAYWSSVGWQDTIERNKRAFTLGIADACSPDERAAGGRDDVWGCLPWSAAFVSFVMRAAGIDQAEFPPSAAHWSYVDALVQQSDRWGAGATFLAHEVEAQAPAPGDLICADRSSRGRLATLAQRREETAIPRPMHCEIVIATSPGEVLAVGGNVAQAVTAVRYAADPAGRLRRNARAWFVVFENRIGAR